MIRTVIALALASFLAGCASTMDAGIAHYRVQPFYDAAAGRVLCCQADIINGKDIASITLHVKRGPDDTWQIDLTEQGVNGSNGQAIASQTAAATAGAISKAAAAALIP
jgi:hypothetical protein